MALQCLLGVAIFTAVVARLAQLRPSERSLQCRLWHALWVLAHVALGLGAMTFAIGPISGHDYLQPAALLIESGVCLLLLVRWRRRRDDPPLPQ